MSSIILINFSVFRKIIIILLDDRSGKMALNQSIIGQKYLKLLSELKKAKIGCSLRSSALKVLVLFQSNSKS